MKKLCFLIYPGLFVWNMAFAGDSGIDPSGFFHALDWQDGQLTIVLPDSGVRFWADGEKKTLHRYGEKLLLRTNETRNLTDGRHWKLSCSLLEKQALQREHCGDELLYLCTHVSYPGKYVLLVRAQLDARSFGGTQRCREYLFLPCWNELETSAFRTLFINCTCVRGKYVILSRKQPEESILNIVPGRTNHYEESLFRLQERLKAAAGDLPLKDRPGETWMSRIYEVPGKFSIEITPSTGSRSYFHGMFHCTSDRNMFYYEKFEDADQTLRSKIRNALGGTFHLVITNQSMIRGDAPELTVEIDGIPVTKSKIQSDRKMLQHTLYSFPTLLPPGKHRLKITGGGMDFEELFTIDEQHDTGVLMFVRPRWYEFWKKPEYSFDLRKGPLLWI